MQPSSNTRNKIGRSPRRFSSHWTGLRSCGLKNYRGPERWQIVGHSSTRSERAHAVSFASHAARCAAVEGWRIPSASPSPWVRNCPTDTSSTCRCLCARPWERFVKAPRRSPPIRSRPTTSPSGLRVTWFGNTYSTTSSRMAAAFLGRPCFNFGKNTEMKPFARPAVRSTNPFHS